MNRITFKKVYFKLKYLFFSLKKNEIYFLKTYYSVKMFSNFGDNTFKFCFRGDYGDFLSNYLRNLDSNFVFVDIGANQGLYSVISGKNSFCKKVYAVEPQKKIVKILEKNLIANRINEYEIIPYALSNKKSRINLFSFDNHSGKSTLQSQINKSSIRIEEIETIDSNLIEYIFDLNENYILKIDVEGHEEVVIKELLKIKNFNQIGNDNSHHDILATK